jgi:hypothetical protein
MANKGNFSVGRLHFKLIGPVWAAVLVVLPMTSGSNSSGMGGGVGVSLLMNQ